jgi:hypothetical protein
MDLPAELRNLVYGSVAKGRTAFLENGTLTDNSSLLQVNSQVHDEYIPMLFQFAKVIKTDVVDFDFRPIVTFLNRLSAAELNALPSLTRPSRRSVDIALRFSYVSEYPDDKLLRRWLNRAGSTTKKGTMLDFRYSLGLPARKASRQGAHRYWRRPVANFRAASNNERAKREATKVLQTLSA